MKHTVITRTWAHEAGMKRYYTGRPCKNGHDCERFVSNGCCVQCVNPYSRPSANPHSSLWTAYSPSLWVLKGVATPELTAYLQTCVNHWLQVKADQGVTNIELGLRLSGDWRP